MVLGASTEFQLPVGYQFKCEQLINVEGAICKNFC